MTTRGVSVHWAIFDLVPEAPKKTEAESVDQKGDGKGHKGKEKNKNKKFHSDTSINQFSAIIIHDGRRKENFSFLEKSLEF